MYDSKIVRGVLNINRRPEGTALLYVLRWNKMFGDANTNNELYLYRQRFVMKDHEAVYVNSYNSVSSMAIIDLQWCRSIAL